MIETTRIEDRRQRQNTAPTGADHSGGLTRQDFDNLERGYITPELARAAGIFRVDSQAGAEIIGRRPSAGADYAGLVFPNFLPEAEHAREYRLRLDHPPLERKADGSTVERGKYLAPPGRGNLLYFAPATPSEALADLSRPVVIAEGEKKALALARFYAERGEAVLVVGLSGVWSWRGVVGKKSFDGHTQRVIKGVISDLDRIAWRGRRVTIIFDANAATDPSVRAARSALSRELKLRGAEVFWVDLPAEGGVNGIDDLLALRGPEAVAEILEQPRAAAVTFKLTDLGNAERFVALCGDRARYCHPWRRWLIWDGRRWSPDDRGSSVKLAKETVRAIYGEAAQTSDDAERQALASHARRSEGRERIKAMLELAQPELSVLPSELDVDPWLLNALNGTLDLRTGLLRPHDPQDNLTKLAPVGFEGLDAAAPTFARFLSEIFAGDKDVIASVRRAFGYSITGQTVERVVIICLGKGRNGKTTLLETIARVLGPDYATTIDVEALLQQRDRTPPHELADLHGARLVTAGEVDKGRRLSEGLIKRLSGNERLRACRKYEHSFTFDPQFTVWLSSNNKPVIKGTDDGIWDRILLVPFPVRFYDPQREDIPAGAKVVDLSLGQKLLAEAAGVLAWLVGGCLDWQANGLKVAETVRSASAAYRREMDALGDFLSGCCIVGPEYNVRASALLDAYQEFTGETVSPKEFKAMMEARDYESKRRTQGVFWLGVGLLSAPSDD